MIFTPTQLEYFESQAIPRTQANLSKLATVLCQLQSGDALGNPLPEASKALLETQGIDLFTSIAEAFAGLSQAIAALRVGDNSLINQIIPPV